MLRAWRRELYGGVSAALIVAGPAGPAATQALRSAGSTLHGIVPAPAPGQGQPAVIPAGVSTRLA
jgi:hypothetical protein